MAWLKVLRSRLRALRDGDAVHDEMDEEFRFHIDMRTEENIRRGMPADEARRDAERRFGERLRTREQGYDVRGGGQLEATLQDVRFAWRGLRKSPAFSLVAVLSLALGIGANTALFSLIDAVLLRRLPVKNPQELVLLGWVSGPNSMARSINGNLSIDPATGWYSSTSLSSEAFNRLRAQSRTLSDVFAFASIDQVNANVDGQSELASGQLVSGDYYAALGVSAAHGRVIDASDDRETADAVAVISHRYWQRRFGSDPAVLGKTVDLNNVPFTIIGITPPGFSGTLQVGESPDYSVPLSMEPRVTLDESSLHAPGVWWLQVMGRLEPGTTAEQARAGLEGVFLQSVLDDYHDAPPQLVDDKKAPDRPRLTVQSGSRGLADMRRGYTHPLTILMAVVGLVLLIACVNVANLLLSRATARHKEVAMRLALGASRLRLIRQLLVESVMLAGLGGIAGLVLACWSRGLLLALRPWGGAPLTIDLTLDWRVLGFTLVVSLLTGIVFGLAPALRATGVDVAPSLKDDGRAVIGVSRLRLSKALIIAQVAMSLLLLIGAGLFARTLRNLYTSNLGFNSDNVLVFRIDPQLSRYPKERIASLYQQLSERIEAVPGVRTASFSGYSLLSNSSSIQRPHIAGHNPPGRRDYVFVQPVRANFLRTMEIPLLHGRSFTPHDDDHGQRVAIISQAMADKFFRNEDPIGKRFGFDQENSLQIEIVGVARDAKYTNMRDEMPATVFVPYMQNPSGLGRMSFVVRAAGDPQALIPALRHAVAEVDKNLPLLDIKTLNQQAGEALAQERLFATLSCFFGVVALLLSCIGLYGVMSYTVTRRTNEIGVRMALGARTGSVQWLVLRETLWLALIGVAIGLPAALAGTRWIASMLYGLTPNDMTTSTLATLLLIAVASFAGYLPARRAARLDPMQALRHE